MAYTKIHAIKATVHKAINYICNPDKTDESILISSFGCSPETAPYDFKFALSKTRQSDENKAFHLIQSFLPGEVSFEEAHRIGTELADKLLEGKYNYIVSTHIDKGHVHNHLIFCAADNIKHKKYNDCKRSYYHIRHLSDDLCKEHNLSIITPGKERGKPYQKWLSDQNTSTDITAIRKDINAAIKAASTYEDFIALMKAKSYEISGETFGENAHKYISFRPMGRERAVRGSDRSLGKEYTKEAIKNRIENKSKTRTVIPQKDDAFRKLIDTSTEKFQNSSGLKHWADIQNLKIAASSYSASGSIAELEEQIAAKNEISKTAHTSLLQVDKRLKELAEIIKYADQYTENRTYNYRYKKSKNPDAYLQKHESEIILYGGAKRMLERYGINPKQLQPNTLKKQHQKLQEQKKSLSSTHKSAEKESQQLQQKLDNIRSYLDIQKSQNLDVKNLHIER